jgi:uncharacterized protein (TIGR03032 family)
LQSPTDSIESAGRSSPGVGATMPTDPPPLRSVHTSNFPGLMAEGGFSILVSTYQAGKLVILRADEGVLNTHFRSFDRPMGLAEEGGRLAIGTSRSIWEFHDVPAVARKVEPPGKHDAGFLPRTCHFTGDVRVHEMAWGRVSEDPESSSDLIFVNTLFSCLCVRSDRYSFRPVWRPPFVSALEPSDRCHLNGLGMRDGRARYVTALGATDTAAGWRANKKDGGLLLDVPDGRTLVAGLSMPHSPRWHLGRLWVLESGTGTIGHVDEAAGRYVPIAELPGFARGLDFFGPLAFVGLSQVRESATFGGLPITEREGKLHSGVWVVHLETGRVVAFVRFEDAVQEIFAVVVLPNRRFPEVISEDPALQAGSYVLPDDALDDVPAGLRSPAGRG